MNSYPKINSIFKRDKAGKLIWGDFSCPEFAYLANNTWRMDEKLDGMNIRCLWYSHPLIEELEIRGRTDKARLDNDLVTKIKSLISINKLKEIFPVGEERPDVCLYGEGLSHKINKGGKYFPEGKGYDFVLFDIKIGQWYLKREDIEEIALKLGIKIAPIFGYGTLYDVINAIKHGIKSSFGNFLAEGLVLRPAVDLRSRSGGRIISKVKHRDFGIG